ncbi:MAG: hypothetical protein ACPGF7_09535 [Pontibacterium sp.]
MPARFSTAIRTARATSLLTAIDAGAGPGTIKFYTGTQPATPATAVTTEVLLGTLTCSDPVGTVTNGVFTFDAITQDSSADATGVATWARIADSNGLTVMDLDVGAIGSGASVEISTTSITIGGPIQITSAVITEGNA